MPALARGGNPATLEVYPGGPHGFDAHPTQLARRARDRMDQFIAARLKEAAAGG